ncbi:hypothetical protein [Burkholderia pseudomallei]|uniref:hypothetical protein n=1 Tax=Burkholderia pseudomallei TaxID=28450 RepID=UPI0009B24053|nr:hypothetical protein [Burkholderia pseudomallei]
MADRRQLEAELAKLDTRLADERQTVSDCRRQLDRCRPIAAPSVGCTAHPEEQAAAELRVVLAARRDAVSRLKERHAAVAAELAEMKRLQPAS